MYQECSFQFSISSEFGYDLECFLMVTCTLSSVTLSKPWGSYKVSGNGCLYLEYMLNQKLICWTPKTISKHWMVVKTFKCESIMSWQNHLVSSKCIMIKWVKLMEDQMLNRIYWDIILAKTIWSLGFQMVYLHHSFICVTYLSCLVSTPFVHPSN